MRSRRSLRILFAAVAALVACAQFLPGTSSSFTAATANSGNSVTAKADWTAPTISATAVRKAAGGVTNKLGQGETFYVYANAADTGNPASGLGTVTASVTNVATVATATMTAGSYTVGAATYGFRTALLTAKATLATGTYAYSISVSDTAGNGPSTLAGSVSVDNTAFAPSSFLTTNVATAGKILATDTMTLTYNHAPDPESVFSGWDGSSRTVNVALSDGAVYGLSPANGDLIGVTDSAGAATSLGYIVTGGNYAANSTTVSYPNSTIVLSGSTYTVTLGTPSNTANLNTDTSSNTATWTPNATAFDTFGNASSATTITGTARVQF
jgi:hypothetical protein